MMFLRRKIALWLCPELGRDKDVSVFVRTSGRQADEPRRVDTSIYKSMIELSELYASHLNISHWRVSYLVRKDGQFFKRIKAGSGCTVKTAAFVLDWFSQNWPDDLEWPDYISRPTDKGEAA